MSAHTPGWFPTHQHTKRGTFYRVIGTAELQASMYSVGEGDPLVVYQGADGKLWARYEDEFRDGRFVALEEAAPEAEVDTLRSCNAELLAVLRELLPHVGVGYSGAQRHAVMEKARAAIARAEGRTP